MKTIVDVLRLVVTPEEMLKIALENKMEYALEHYQPDPDNCEPFWAVQTLYRAQKVQKAKVNPSQGANKLYAKIEKEMDE